MSYLYRLQLQEGEIPKTGQLVLVMDMETGCEYQTIITETKENERGDIVFINVMVDPLPAVELN